MRTGRLVFLSVGFMGLVLVTSSLPIGNGAEEDRTIVERAIRDSIGWAQTKDRPLLESVLSQTEDFFIFHPDSKSTVVGYESFEKRFEGWLDPRFKATQFDVRDLRINFSSAGDTAWFSSILDDCAEWDGQPMCWEDARWTGVLEKRDGKWVIVQMHFSLASDKVRAEASSKETIQPASWRRTSSQKHSFEIEAWEKRLNKRQPPMKIMDGIGAAPGKLNGEIGAGTGRVTMGLAERVGKSGKIYANDGYGDYVLVPAGEFPMGDTYRIVRGSDWHHDAYQNDNGLYHDPRCAWRNSEIPSVTGSNFGFRCVREK